jgi:hypothetical protein
MADRLQKGSIPLQAALDALGVTLPRQFGELFPALPRQPSLRILLGAPISAPRSMGTAGKVGNELICHFPP